MFLTRHPATLFCLPSGFFLQRRALFFTQKGRFLGHKNDDYCELFIVIVTNLPFFLNVELLSMFIVGRNERMQKIVYCPCSIVIVGLTMTIPTMTIVSKKNAHPWRTACPFQERANK
jgi:hypothetical protein